MKLTADNLIFAATLFAALGSGLIAGVFFAFSAFMMKALARLSPAEGIAAMQSINVAVINPWFLAAFFGTAATCVILTVSTLFQWHRPGAGCLLVGSLLYLFGTMLVTIAFNVPKNEALATVDPRSAEAGSVWNAYVTNWTNWNHVRTVAAFGAAASLTISLPLVCTP